MRKIHISIIILICAALFTATVILNYPIGNTGQQHGRAVWFFEGEITSYSQPMIIRVEAGTPLQISGIIELNSESSVKVRDILLGERVGCTSTLSAYAELPDQPLSVWCTLQATNQRISDKLLMSGLVVEIN